MSNKKILVCVDGSAFSDNVCYHAAWVAKETGADIDLLHVLRRHSDYKASGDDHTGAIGLGVRDTLLEELTSIDEERGALDIKKGELILEHCKFLFKAHGVTNVNVLHRRGSLVETINSYEDDVEVIFMGKRGEHSNVGDEFLGSNLEKTARSVKKPMFVTTATSKPVEKFLIAYDGKENVAGAIDYIIENDFLKDKECHVLSVKGCTECSEAVESLTKAGFKVTVNAEEEVKKDADIAEYIQSNNIDLMITGAYSCSRLKGALLGGTTASLIKVCKIPMMIFR